jgi:hypothetical protein
MLVVATILAGSAMLQARVSEYQVKAAYLCSFGNFIRWSAPVNSTDTYPICVLGRDPFGSLLDDAVAGGSIDGRRMVARRIAQPKDAPGCRVVFVSASEEPQLVPTLAALSVWRVLTVSDMPDFTKRGGMVQFIADADRVRFEVNLTSADESGITMSAELLKVAVVVRRIRPGV